MLDPTEYKDDQVPVIVSEKKKSRHIKDYYKIKQ